MSIELISRAAKGNFKSTANGSTVVNLVSQSIDLQVLFMIHLSNTTPHFYSDIM
jgi:hypothetical protein